MPGFVLEQAQVPCHVAYIRKTMQYDLRSLHPRSPALENGDDLGCRWFLVRARLQTGTRSHTHTHAVLPWVLLHMLACPNDKNKKNNYYYFSLLEK
jgi:hypothetical protein